MPSEIEKKSFGNMVKDDVLNCGHSTAVLSLGGGNGVCMQCGKPVKTVTIDVYDPMYMRRDGFIIPYPKRVWKEN